MARGSAPGRKPLQEGEVRLDRAGFRRIRGQAVALLTMGKNATKAELEALGIRGTELEDLALVLTSTEPVANPTAAEAFLAAYGEGLSKEVVATAYHRTLLSMHALAPLVGLRLAQKIDSDQAPGSARVLIEMAKGLGILTPAAPIDSGKRMQMLELGDLRKKTKAELLAELHR